jgi:hypothetical protein
MRKLEIEKNKRKTCACAWAESGLGPLNPTARPTFSFAAAPILVDWSGPRASLARALMRQQPGPTGQTRVIPTLSFSPALRH